MPRARKPGSGGSRQGQPGQSYTNRTDLNTNRASTGTVPGQQYGKGVEQQAIQKMTPRPGDPDSAPAQQAGSPGAAPSPAPGGPLPGSLGAFDRPSQRGSEPVTAGMDMGAGPGSEVLRKDDPDAEDMGNLRGYLPALEIMANLPTTSIQTRNLVRRLRGAMPPQQEGMQAPIPQPQAPTEQAAPAGQPASPDMATPPAEPQAMPSPDQVMQ